MSRLQVVVDGENDGAQIAAVGLVNCVQTLLTQTESVHVINVSAAVGDELRARFGKGIGSLATITSGQALLLTSARAVFASGSTRRMSWHSEMPGRCLTRVLLPGIGGQNLVRCFSAKWLASFDGDLADLVRADLTFDRQHLPTSSPTARAWVRGDELGVALAANVDGDLSAWQRRVGAQLDVQRWWGQQVRARAGVARRRLSRRRQRRAQP